MSDRHEGLSHRSLPGAREVRADAGGRGRHRAGRARPRGVHAHHVVHVGCAQLEAVHHVYKEHVHPLSNKPLRVQSYRPER